MEYPRIKRDDKLSVKMTRAKIKEAIGFRQEGWSINKIANEFSVSWATIAVYVDPKYRNYYRKKYLKFGGEKSSNQIMTDRRFRKRQKKYCQEKFRVYKREGNRLRAEGTARGGEGVFT